MLRIVGKYKIISTIILITFLFETAVYDLAIAQPTIPTTANNKLAPQLRLADDGPDPKYIALAEMHVAMELNLISNLKNTYRETNARNIIQACQAVQKITKLENTRKEHNPAEIEAFFNQIEHIGGYIFTVPVTVRKKGVIRNYRLLFSTDREEGKPFSVVYLTDEEFNSRRSLIAAQKVLPSRHEDDMRNMESFKEGEAYDENVIKWAHEEEKTGRMDIVSLKHGDSYHYGVLNHIAHFAGIDSDCPLMENMLKREIYIVPYKSNPDDEVHKRLKKYTVTIRLADGTYKKGVVAYAHSSNGATHIFVTEEDMRDIKKDLEKEEMRFKASSRLTVSICHEMGVISRCPVIRFERDNPVNTLDFRYAEAIRTGHTFSAERFEAFNLDVLRWKGDDGKTHERDYAASDKPIDQPILWKDIDVAIGEPVPLSELGHALAQFVKKKQPFTLRYNGNELKGLLYEIESKTYIQYGDRWIVIMKADIEKGLPLRDVIDGQLLLGNPSLREFLGMPRVSLAQATKILPKGIEAVAELKNLFNTEYSAPHRRMAIEVLQGIDLLGLARLGTLDDETLINYLDALTIVSHENVAAYEEFIGGVSRVKMLLKIAFFLPNFHVDAGLIAAIPGLLNFMTKRKMTFPKPLLDLIAERSALREFIKIQPDSRRTVVDSNGKIREIDVANEVNWVDSADVKDIERKLAGDAQQIGMSLKDYLSLFNVTAEIGVAGEGTRALENHFRLNKLFGRMVRVKKGCEAGVVEFFRSMGFKHFQLVRFGEYYYIGISHIILARNPGSVIIAGMPTIEPSEEWVMDIKKDVAVKTQDVASILRLDGTFKEGELGIAGHGRLIICMMESQESIAAMIENGNIWRHVQGEDFGNILVGQIMARAVKRGEAPMVALTTPQRIFFESNLVKITAWFNTGKTMTLNGKQVVKIVGDQIVFEDDSVIDVSRILGQLQEALEQIEKLNRMAEGRFGQAQRDTWIHAMQIYQDDIFDVVNKGLRFEAGHADSDKITLFTIMVNAGGHLLEGAGVNMFVEQSNYSKKVTMKDGAGQSHVFDLGVFLAVIPKNFNTNNFCLDPLAVAANRDRRIKEAYHDYLRFASRHKEDMAAVLAKRKETESFAVNIIREMPRTEWEARTMLVERLMISILPPPVELKGKGESSYVKLNMMAQDVASFESMLALTQVTADDVVINNINEVIQAASGGATYSARADAKNGLFLSRQGKPLNFSTVSGVTGQPIMIIQVPETCFTQVKTSEQYADFVGIVNRVFVEEGRGELFEPMGATQTQGANLQEWASMACEYRFIGSHVAYKLKEIGELIAENGDILADAPEASQRSYAETIELMQRLRDLVYKEDYAAIFAWSKRCESLGNSLTTDHMKAFLDITLDTTSKTADTRRAYDYIIEGNREVTVIDLALRLGITESTACGILEYLASFDAGKDGFPGIDKKVTDDGRIVYYHLDVKPANMQNVYVMIPAGGENKGLWPMDTDTTPRHLRPFMPDGENMLEYQIAMITALGIPLDHILVSTKSRLVEQVRHSLPAGFPQTNIILEPPTYASAAVVGLGLKNVEARFGPDKTLVIMPVENTLSGNRAEILSALESAVQAAQNGFGLAAVGIQPREANTTIGYIEYDKPSKIGKDNFTVEGFVEKPGEEKARQLVADGRHLVNTGIIAMNVEVGIKTLRSFSLPLAMWLDEVTGHAGGVNLPNLSDKCAVSLKDAFADILRNAGRFTTVRARFSWYHNSEWALVDAASTGRGNQWIGPMSGQSASVVFDEATRNTFVYSGSGIKVIAKGIQDLIVVVQGDAVLVMLKSRAHEIRKIVDKLRQNPETKSFITGEQTSQIPVVVRKIDTGSSQVRTDRGLAVLFGVQGIDVTRSDNIVHVSAAASPEEELFANVGIGAQQLAQVVNEYVAREAITAENLNDGKTGFIFSELTTFGDEEDGKEAQGIGIILPELAKAGIKVAVLLSSDPIRRARQENLIKELNEAIDINKSERRIRYGTSVVEISNGFTDLNAEKPARFYYLKTNKESEISGVIDSIDIVVKDILRILGKICGIIQEGQEPDKLYEAAKKFARAT